ncbi:hypothetical protein [Microbacterium sp. Root553]|uniref:hypothetical protein n=1 Tax=Microbacterium sp. Root553 TaxID=1736556 RepID=UPI0012F889B5|nr:hypothetical protein [Microbacterium sp. Root553]
MSDDDAPGIDTPESDDAAVSSDGQAAAHALLEGVPTVCSQHIRWTTPLILGLGIASPIRRPGVMNITLDGSDIADFASLVEKSAGCAG